VHDTDDCLEALCTTATTIEQETYRKRSVTVRYKLQSNLFRDCVCPTEGISDCGAAIKFISHNRTDVAVHSSTVSSQRILPPATALNLRCLIILC
jgi:hypothetical protein